MVALPDEMTKVKEELPYQGMVLPDEMTKAKEDLPEQGTAQEDANRTSERPDEANEERLRQGTMPKDVNRTRGLPDKAKEEMPQVEVTGWEEVGGQGGAGRVHLQAGAGGRQQDPRAS